MVHILPKDFSFYPGGCVKTTMKILYQFPPFQEGCSSQIIFVLLSVTQSLTQTSNQCYLSGLKLKNIALQNKFHKKNKHFLSFWKNFRLLKFLPFNVVFCCCINCRLYVYLFDFLFICLSHCHNLCPFVYNFSVCISYLSITPMDSLSLLQYKRNVGAA